MLRRFHTVHPRNSNPSAPRGYAHCFRLLRMQLQPQSVHDDPYPPVCLFRVRLEDRFNHYLRRHLHHPVAHRRYPQWSLLPVRLRNVPPPHRLRSILACPQGLFYPVQEFSDHLSADTLTKRARCSLRVTARSFAPSCRRFRRSAQQLGSPLMTGPCYRALRRLPGRDFHPLEWRSFHGAPQNEDTKKSPRCQNRCTDTHLVGAYTAPNFHLQNRCQCR